MTPATERLRDELLQAKEQFDRDVFAHPQLSQAQRLHLWAGFLDMVAPLARRLAAAERREMSRPKRPQVSHIEVYPN